MRGWYSQIHRQERTQNNMHKQSTLLCVVSVVVIVLFTGCNGTPTTLQLRNDGVRANNQQDYPTAISYFEQVLERKPEDPEANLQIGVAYLETGNYFRARTHLTIAYEQTWSRAGKADEVLGYLAATLAALDDRDALFSLLSERAHGTNDTQDYLRWGDYAVMLGDPDNAELAFLTAARVDNAHSVEPYMRLALLYKTLGNKDEEVMRLRQAYSIDPYNEQVLTELGRHFTVLGPTLGLPAE